MKGVVLAGGFGTRLMPLTKIINKHLLPIYNKPMIYYPLECLAKSGVAEVLLVTGGKNADDFEELLGDGAELGLQSLQYTYQEGAGGIAQALGLAEAFASGSPIVLILGDNIVQYTIDNAIQDFKNQGSGARVLLTPVDDPKSFGVVELDGERVVRILEKPAHPPSNLAVIGIYLYDQNVFEVVKQMKPSERGELEITDVNNAYLERGELSHSLLRGWWLDAGEDFDSYLASCNRVATEGANHRYPASHKPMKTIGAGKE